MRILVADQDLEHRRNLLGYIQALGHQTQEALTAREVTDLCKAKCPDLIFLDKELSGVSGIEVIRQIRQLGGHAVWVPIVLMGKTLNDEEMQQSIDAGCDDCLTKPVSKIRVQIKLKSAERILSLKEEVFQIAHHLVISSRVLENVVTQDTLTGVGNVNAFDDALERDWFAAKKENTPLALIMLNLDYFQAFNQAYGAARGDEVIKLVAEALKKGLPSSEATLARTIGETFAIILPNTMTEDAVKISEKLRTDIELLAIPHVDSGCSDHLTASFGVSVAEPGHYTSPWDLKEAADFALYQAKHYGRNRTHLELAKENIEAQSPY